MVNVEFAKKINNQYTCGVTLHILAAKHSLAVHEEPIPIWQFWLLLFPQNNLNVSYSSIDSYYLKFIPICQFWLLLFPQNNLNVSYSSIDSYYLKLQSIMSRFILEKNHMLTDIVTKSFLNLKLRAKNSLLTDNFWNSKYTV